MVTQGDLMFDLIFYLMLNLIFYLMLNLYIMKYIILNINFIF